MKIIERYLGPGLLAITLCIGLLTFDAYGITWDEEEQHLLGQLNYNYIFNDDTALMSFEDREYGAAFELPLIFIEKIFHISDSRNIYLMRHLVSHCFFLLGAFCIFLLIDFMYKNKVLAAMGFLLIVLHPVIYGHSFFNSKDIPFMSMFMICFYLAALAFKQKKNIYFLLLGIATGFLIDIRVMGVLILCIVPLFIGIDLILERKDKSSQRQQISFLATFVLSSIATIYICWPYLWADPVDRFFSAFMTMSKYHLPTRVLFNGLYLMSTDLKWYYSGTWFLMTNPIVYLLVGFIGIGFLAVNIFKKPFSFLSNTIERNNLIYGMCFFGPLTAVILLHSVLYDGWRQLYFIYPSFVLLIIYGTDQLFKTKLKFLVAGSFALTFSWILFYMVSNFPFQYVYFNKLISNNEPEYLRKRFELDFWYISYKQCLEYILENDSSRTIDVSATNSPDLISKEILKPEDRVRIHNEDIKKAKYLITNYRFHPQDFSEYKEWHSFKVLNNSVSTIYIMR